MAEATLSMATPHVVEIPMPVQTDADGKERYKCTHPCCAFLKPYFHQVSLTKHVHKQHPGTTLTFACGYCSFKDVEKKKVGSHIRANHKDGVKGKPAMQISTASRNSATPSPPTALLQSRPTLRAPRPNTPPQKPGPTSPSTLATAGPHTSNLNESQLLQDVPDPEPLFHVSEFVSRTTVNLQGSLDDHNTTSQLVPNKLPCDVSLENAQIWIGTFDACRTNEELDGTIDALTTAISNRIEAPPNKRRPHQPLKQQHRKRTEGYDPRAAARIQRIYKRNRKRAFREITEGDSQYCQIPKESVQEHFTAVFNARQREATPPPMVVPEWEPLQDPGDTDPLRNPFTDDEVAARLSKCSDTSPGPDGIRYSTWKKLPSGTTIITAIFNAVLRIGHTPESWTTSTTILLHKKGDVSDISNWRPVAMSNTLGKLYASTLSYRLTNWARRNGRISASQKGFMPYEGCLEHNSTLQNVIQHARRSKSQAAIAWLDLRNAFGSIPHSTIFQCLALAGLADTSIDVIRVMYSGCTTSIRCGNDFTDPIHIMSGVKQGCPLSPIVFNLALEPIIRAVEKVGQGFQIHGRPIAVLGYADDLALISSSVDGLQQQLEVASDVANWAGLCFNARKCASLHIPATKSGVSQTVFKVQGEPMEVINESGAYQHLGVPTGYKVHDSAIKTVENMKSQLLAIDQSLLSPWQKFDALHCFVISQLSFHLKTGHVPKRPLNELDKTIRRVCKGWLNLPARASPEILYLPYALGGQNLLPLSQLADVCRLTRAVRLLTSNDTTIAELSKNTMVEVASKRIRAEATPEATAQFFNGDSSPQFTSHYEDVESAWTHLRKAATELKKVIDIEWEPCEEGFRLKVNGTAAGRNTTESQLRNALRLMYYRKLISKPDQGKVIEITAAVPASNHFCRSGNFMRFSEWRFIFRARTNLVPLNGCNRSSRNNNKACRRCGNPNETLPHVLNHCRPQLINGTKRHNAILTRLQKAVKLGPNVEVYENQPIPGVDSTLRPDWVTVDADSRKVNIIDVTVPFESRTIAFHNAREAKRSKYAEIASHFKALGYDTFVDAFIVGSLGGYDPQNNAVTTRLGINSNYLGLMKKLMVSDTIRWSRDIYIQHVTGVRQSHLGEDEGNR